MNAPARYQLVETRLQERLADGTTRCNLCLWRCRIGHGQRGFCQAHVNRNGTLYNLSWGILSSISIDAIEDKPVRHFRPGTRVLSVGSYGCSFRCGGCHNLDISWGVSALDDLARGRSTAAWVRPQELVDTAVRAGVQGIAFTYSEPAVWLEYVLDVSRLAHQAGLYTVYVSNSFVTDEALELMAPHIDVLCSDIKSLSDDFYREICRPARVRQVLHAIRRASELGIHVETRTNIIPGKNDDPREHYRIARWVRDHLGSDSPWHITRFFPAYRLADVPPTPEASLFAARDEALRAGLRNVYVYNDKGCDCAGENRPLEYYLEGGSEQLHQPRKCAAACCGEDGVLLKKYEQAGGNTE
ncbi:MAG TPA: AmmeMemoRadiSam system radical SAM enzyme [Gammaproteobacteria bacterium]|nr:AmmeMemoRadiSam system radical SAM enzyme [Gammaproteobacteria bacterium]